MESEATPTVEANFRPPETRGNFNIETPADSGVMDINSQEYAEYKSGVEAADQARLAEVRADLAEFMTPPENETSAGFEPFTQPSEYEPAANETANIRQDIENPLPQNIAELTTYDKWFSDTEKRNKNLEVVDGKYIVEYVPREALDSPFIAGTAYGTRNGGNYARVREDLPSRAKNFVKAHELYHLQDKKGGGKFLREFRANFYPTLKDPVGFLSFMLWAYAETGRITKKTIMDRIKK